MFLLCDDDPLLETDAIPSNKLMDRSRTEGETVYTLRWLSVAANRRESFKQIDGQVENWRKHSFYFAMMICCCWWISVLQGHLGTGRQPKKKLFILCDDELLALIDLRPVSELMDRWRTERETVYTFWWWSVDFTIFISQFCQGIWPKRLVFVDLNYFGIYLPQLETPRSDFWTVLNILM